MRRGLAVQPPADGRLCVRGRKQQPAVGARQERRIARVTPVDGAAGARAYVEHLRGERRNGDAAVGRHVVVLRSFYRAMVAMGELAPARNPLAHFPKLRAPTRKLPRVLEELEVKRLLEVPEAF